MSILFFIYEIIPLTLLLFIPYKEIDGKKIEGTFRAHQVPIEVNEEHPQSLQRLEEWLRSYRPEELFDKNGSLKEKYRLFIPPLEKTMGANPIANGGELLQELKMPDFKKYALQVPYPGQVLGEDMRGLGPFIRDVIKNNPTNFRVFGPDETLSNRLNAVFEVTNRQWDNKRFKDDEFLSYEGRVIDSFLSEHFCEGVLEGYLLTGRHGFFHSYESFIRIVDSMISQHAKWLKVSKELGWREPIASLNLLVSSHCWQQDHNGYTHQDPGIINHVLTKKAAISRVYLPCDTNTLLCVMNHVLESKDYINVVVASKHPRPQWLTKEKAKKHCQKGIGIWDFASNDEGKPDIIMACAGETPTLETLAAIDILKTCVKDIKIRMINVVDLTKLAPRVACTNGLTEEEYDNLFTKDVPIIFNFHGYKSAIEELTYQRTNRNMYIHGYQEEGTITTSFDMRVQNEIDRFHLVMDALLHIPRYKKTSKVLINWCQDMLKQHTVYIRQYGEDLPYIKNWTWNNK